VLPFISSVITCLMFTYYIIILFKKLSIINIISYYRIIEEIMELRFDFSAWSRQ